MSKKNENTNFICENCGNEVKALTDGSYRNHCPKCLYSKHLDYKPGDRLSDCFGMMKPISVKYNSKKGYQIIHKCMDCGYVICNRITEDNCQPDNFEEVIKLTSI